ncbi:MAG: cobalt-precorrin 5A hydrolase [Firmicutes bacterium]|nr:cobalt-precorrin 5A hydrolase [Bacillota bacterium]
MKIAVFAYSRQGCRMARKIMLLFPQDDIRPYTMERFAEEGFQPIGRPAQPFYGEIFNWADTLIFVGSCGIAVREIAPHVRDKRTDPAVVCIDELGRFAVSLLSGHIGGANETAAKIAAELHATPVITTATDINNKFSVDAWAAKNGFVIDNMHRAKMVSAAILEQAVPLVSDFAVTTDTPNGVVFGDGGELGICISYLKKEPFEQTLRLIPQILHIGIGCRRGTPAAVIHEAIQTVLAQHKVDIRAVKSVASIDLKADEEGLWEFCENNGFSPSFYSAAELLQVQGEFTPSAFVQSVTGVDNVCERAALMGADELIVKKTAINGVTVAVAAEKLEVRFE